MSGYIICLTSGSGIPVFTRATGNVKTLPFPVIGSLNAVHMFAANQNASLKSTTTDSAKIVWQEFHDSVVLISVQNKDTTSDDVTAAKHLELVFNAMVMLYGLEDLTNIKNVERFKREIKISHQLIDTLLLQDDLPFFIDLHHDVDVIVAPEGAMLQNFLQAFTEAAGSSYGCLFIHGKVMSATDKWWSLSPMAMTLLQLLIFSFSKCTSRDVPVYVPHLSPKVGRFWMPAIDSLKAVRHLHHRSFPLYIDINSHVLGFILINNKSRKSLSSVNIVKDIEDSTKLEKRRSLLRSFYKQVMGSYFPPVSDEPGTGSSHFSHEATDAYIVCSGHKCYAHSSDVYQIFVLYCSKIPTFSMRSVTQKILSLIVKDKSLCI